jgi:hypothetical protein
MAQRSDGRATPWLVFVVGALVVAVASIGLMMYKSASKSDAKSAVSLNIGLPKAPELPQTPKLPPPPIPVPK